MITGDSTGPPNTVTVTCTAVVCGNVSVALTAKAYVPGTVGVPEISPFDELMLSPGILNAVQG